MLGDTLEGMQQATGRQQQRQQQTADTMIPDCGSRHPHGPTAEEWDAVKDVIRQLYVEDQYPLKQVKSALEARYNFRATYDQASSKQNPTSLGPGTRLIRRPGSACSKPDWALGV